MTSSSFTPASRTTLTLSGVSPAASAASMAFRTTARSPRRRIWAKRSGRNESQLMLTRIRPASASGRATATKPVPLVVRAMSSKPTAPSWRTSSTIPLRTRGSPPVRRTDMTPSPNATRCHACYLLEGEDLLAGPEGDTLLGHAVHAAKVAAVRHREAQVAVDAAIGVHQRPLAGHRVAASPACGPAGAGAVPRGALSQGHRRVDGHATKVPASRGCATAGELTGLKVQRKPQVAALLDVLARLALLEETAVEL